MTVSCGIVLALGFLYMMFFQPYDRGSSPYADAHVLFGDRKAATEETGRGDDSSDGEPVPVGV
ncbi:MAG: hypothetical protein LBE85_09255 [Candidatus Accumulibacter sp.]|jgi:hypothetical protein|nr:hypothetical protein [Accumulibacter sp.]